MQQPAELSPVLVLDLLGVLVFGLSGGLAAVRARFDLVGVVVLAGAAGLGGGVLRDVLIGAVPPVGISDGRLIAAAAIAGLLSFWFHPGIERLQRLVLVLDGFGLGLFAVAGTLKALELGVDPLPSVFVGVLTGVGGGVLRDVLTGQPPVVLAGRQLYLTPALLGATAIAVAWALDLRGPVVLTVCALLTAVVRLAALRFDWEAPVPRG